MTTPIRASWLLALVLTTPALGQIQVTNLEPGETLRYPVALLIGTAEGDGPIRVANATNAGLDGVNEAPIVAGRFRLLVELVPRLNHLTLSAGPETSQLDLNYLPLARGPFVRVVYITDASGTTDYVTQKPDDRQNVRDKLDTMAKLLQTFTAETMHRAGHGRKTVRLELDACGRVVIHTVRHPATASFLRSLPDQALYAAVLSCLGRPLPMEDAKNLTIMGFSGYDPATKKALAHTALGGGGLALFSNLSLFTWPDSIHDVSRAFSDDSPIDTSRAYQDVGLPTCATLASTTLGAVLHELGHTFELPHSDDPRCIMSRGFDHFRRTFLAAEERDGQLVAIEVGDEAYFSPPMALRLAENRWFQADNRPEDGDR